MNMTEMPVIYMTPPCPNCGGRDFNVSDAARVPGVYDHAFDPTLMKIVPRIATIFVRKCEGCGEAREMTRIRAAKLHDDDYVTCMAATAEIPFTEPMPCPQCNDLRITYRQEHSTFLPGEVWRITCQGCSWWTLRTLEC